MSNRCPKKSCEGDLIMLGLPLITSPITQCCKITGGPYLIVILPLRYIIIKSLLGSCNEAKWQRTGGRMDLESKVARRGETRGITTGACKNEMGSASRWKKTGAQAREGTLATERNPQGVQLVLISQAQGNGSSAPLDHDLVLPKVANTPPKYPADCETRTIERMAIFQNVRVREHLGVGHER
ncbi:hypothetical protein FB451DRAFT_1172821 [Mycena latifolia]|nr:hypothetical protein FB451DRAFT_1172821 [Mycena latifolia]